MRWLPPQRPTHRPPVRRGWKIALAVLTALAWTPLVSILAASAIATTFGCTLNEASAHPCVVAGVDLGETLVVMFVMGWLAIFGLPFMVATLFGWLVVWSRRARAS